MIKTAVIGCGLIGQRRAREANSNDKSELTAVSDINKALADQVAETLGVKSYSDWQEMLKMEQIDVVIIATPNKFLYPIATEAMKNGCHVLIEKPMGRNLEEAKLILEATQKHNKKLKIGFNHRYHPAILKAWELVNSGKMGKIINIRANYGHGGRPGYENEWRGNLDMAGGGELTDQGVHIIDLIQWFLGEPTDSVAYLQNAIWPIKPLEDNAFAMLKFKDGQVASFHTSWTQWKNQFVFEIFCEKGSVSINGLGGSYGVETLTIAKRKAEGGAPEMEFEEFIGEDFSWRDEWNDFICGINDHSHNYFAPAEDGLKVMRTLNSLYGKKL